MPVVTFVDPDTIHNPASGTAAPATWFTTLEADFRSITGRVGCSLTETNAQDFTPGVTATLTLSVVEWNNGMTTGAVANAITVPASYAGKYLISASVNVALTTPTGGNTIIMDVLNNAGVIHREYVQHTGAAGGSTAIAATLPHILAVGDDLTMQVTVSANFVDGDTSVSQVKPTLSAVWLSA